MRAARILTAQGLRRRARLASDRLRFARQGGTLGRLYARPPIVRDVPCTAVCGSARVATLRICDASRVGTISGSSTAEIDAPIKRVWALVEDVERAPEWQGGLKALRALERDEHGRAILCESKSDAKVRTVTSTVRFSYDGPSTLAWRQEKGELKSLDGSWELADLGEHRTRATYDLDVDLGRVLGLVIRGPLVDLLRGMLVGARAGELKQAIEGH